MSMPVCFVYAWHLNITASCKSDIFCVTWPIGKGCPVAVLMHVFHLKDLLLGLQRLLLMEVCIQYLCDLLVFVLKREHYA